MPLGPQHRLPKLSRKKRIIDEAQEIIDHAIKQTEDDFISISLREEVFPYVNELIENYKSAGWSNVTYEKRKGEYSDYYSFRLYA